ncbi:hypothetical protein MMC29_004959, partial [Sticta canariensis]|nr:hypothetical protein [Sticta canariensis]
MSEMKKTTSSVDVEGKRNKASSQTTDRIDPDRKIIMAVDFGTTFSGLAWAQSRKPELQTPVIQWPDSSSGGLEGITSDKVPSEIKYDGQSFKWGFQIGDSELRQQWFKLDLDPSQLRGTSDLARRFPDYRAEPSQYNMPTEKIVTDYLTALRKHAEQILRHKLPAGALISTPLEFVMTVPAVWSHAAQAKTRACAEKAGMGLGSALHIVSEPEAAAMYALDAMDPHNIKVGDTFLLVDAGGGTVDLIAYTVKALKPRLKITEASPGSGSLCGSSFLNRIFQKFLKDRFQSDPTWDDDVLEEATKPFDTVIKRSFHGITGEEFMVPVPGLRDNPGMGVRRGRLRMTGAEVQAIFKPVIEEVIRLVLGQIKATGKAVTAILLVGGFGQNAYLRDQIRNAVGDIQVMQSPNGWIAVVRGALMKGLASTSLKFATVRVSGRSARKHYGVKISELFNVTAHEESRRYWSAYDDCDRIDVMDWFVKKGQTVEENKSFRLDYTLCHWVFDGHPKEVRSFIYACADPGDDGPPLYENSNVIELVELTADLSLVPAKKFPQKRHQTGIPYYFFSYQIEVTYFSAYTKYELIYDNINYGAVSA